MSGREPILEVRRLTVGHDHRPVVCDVDLDMAEGDWLALVGPNGCGKTTLLDTMAGRLPPLAGEVRVAGHSLRADPRAARAALGYALPPDALPGRLTLRECLRLFTRLHDRSAPPALIEELIRAWSLSARLDHAVDRSSLGTRQKLGMLLALVGAPRLLVLDESFNGLDPRSALVLEEALEDRLRSGGFAVLLATHALELVRRHARSVVLIDGGRAAARLDRDAVRAAGDRLREVLAAQQVPD